MKVKLQFDKRSIQEFLILNAEKIFAGVVVLCTLMILYFSIRWYGNERFSASDRTPADLKKRADNAKATIEATRPKPLEITDYVSLAQHSRIPVVEQPYDYPNLWNRPLFEMPTLRGEPPLFAPRQLRGSAEFGAFHVSNAVRPAARPPRAGKGPRGVPPAAGPTDENRGKQWVVLTAVVPVAEQETAYIDTFSQTAGGPTRDSTADRPVYRGYWVERVEIISPAEAANPPWNKASKFNSEEATRTAFTEFVGPQAASGIMSSPSANDIVAPDYTDQFITFPLGPLVSRRWTATVAHEPEIPVARTFNEPTGDMPPDMGSGDRMPFRAGPGGVIPDESPFSTKVKPTDLDKTAPPPVDASRNIGEKKPFKLFRFFDFNVEPGKQYVYRVRLVMLNPNLGLSPSRLKDPQAADKKWLDTKWSDPSSVIAVPLDWHVFLSSVPPPKQGTEPSAQVMLTKWKPEKGLEFYKEFTVLRGQVLAFLNIPAKPMPGSIALPATMDESAPMMVEGDAPPDAPPRKAVLPSSSVDFVTDITALDIRGGERLSRRRGLALFAPGEILLMNGDGSLAVHNESDDNPAWDHYQNPGAEPKPKTDPAAPPAKTATDTSRK